MVKILEERERAENEERNKVAHQQMQYNEAMERFLSRHESIGTHPRKQMKSSQLQAPSNSSHNNQLKSLWNAKIEYIRGTAFNKQDEHDKHLFTFPFATSDNSLVTCLEGFTELAEHQHEAVRHDAVVLKDFVGDPIVMTTYSLRTLNPGNDIDKDILRFCLKW